MNKRSYVLSRGRTHIGSVERLDQQSPSSDAVVVARGLRKSYGSLEAVRGVDFSIVHGECFSFLGPNGAGKSTTIRMLSCLSPVGGGELTVLGFPASVRDTRIKARLGIVAQDDNLDLDCTPMENLTVYARYFGLATGPAHRRAEELLAFMQLDPRSRTRARDLSGGMRRRLVIARALMHSPDILILDEPTTGLDPQARLLVWGVVQRLKSEGVTVILTTHYMDEAERLADRIVVMDHGTILRAGTPEQLRLSTVGAEAVEIWQEASQDQETVLALGSGLRHYERHQDALVLYADRPGAISEQLLASGVRPGRMLVRPTDLEDVFLTLTGRDLRE